LKFLIATIGPPTKKLRTDTGSEPFYSAQTSRTAQSPLLTDSKLKSPGGKILFFKKIWHCFGYTVPPFRDLDPGKKIPQQMQTQLPTQMGGLNSVQGGSTPSTIPSNMQQIPPLGKPMVGTDNVGPIKQNKLDISQLNPTTRSGNDWVVV
jgi:hypothetical protein